jgi:hypothetical protein
VNLVFTLIGYIIVLLFSIAVFLFALNLVLEKAKHLHDRMIRYAAESARETLGRYIIGDAYWFSEDPAAMALMRKLGEHISRKGIYEVSQLRDDWRAEVEKQSAKDTK